MLEIKTNENNPCSFALIGRLDTNTAPELETYAKDLFEDSKPQDIIVDMVDCDFVSSAGLRVIVAMQKETSRTGGTLVFKNVSDDIMDVFTMTGFNNILTIER